MSGAKGTSSKSEEPDLDAILDEEVFKKNSRGESTRASVGQGQLRAKDLMGPNVQSVSNEAFERGHSSAAMAGRCVHTTIYSNRAGSRTSSFAECAIWI